ncbi:Histone deacetylase complex subunit 2/3 [Penicillium verhagenii]|uniref:Histone deacetylase complex subunit 2/3 n=1 Tax=Penicillium verhagenii TaxID=1562060 RepID=UPI0025452977|nr:Histone deacetylase complex subunit 2/3 [Penicillium verhagenii]KAJ5947591.1 Histone deacetylase complex subunit 2/3 [Penicillium verhagenii]
MDDKPFHLGNPAFPVPAMDTPSSAEDVEAAPRPSYPETTIPLSVRNETDSVAHTHTAVHHEHAGALLQSSDLSHGQIGLQTIQPSALTVGDDVLTPPGSVRLGPAEFAVALPMDSRVKDDYEKVLTKGASTIDDFLLPSSTPSSQAAYPDHREPLRSKVYELITRLNNVCTHPDLNVYEHLDMTGADLGKQALWAEYSSTKFLFLGYFIELASAHELHIIIAVQNDKKQNVVEQYLRGRGFVYTRPREQMGENSEVSLARGSLSFGVHSSGNIRDMFRAPSAIFVFDATFNPKSPSVEYLRTTYTRNGGLLPIIWFLISNTCEHIQRCLPDVTEDKRLRLLLRCTDRFHDAVGDLQDEALNVQEDAEEIFHYLTHGSTYWPLPTVEPLDMAFFEALVSAEGSEAAEGSDKASQAAAQKRSLVSSHFFQPFCYSQLTIIQPEHDQEDHISKRAKFDLLLDTTQLSQSTKGPTQSLDQELRSLETNLVQMKETHGAEIEEFKNDLSAWKAQYFDMEKTLGHLQHRFESQRTELHDIRKKNKSLESTVITLQQRPDKSKDDISKLKEERTQLKKELEEVRQELKNGVASLADLETAREEIRLLKKENASLERKAEYERNQAEYTREQYQNASNAAAQAGNESRTLQAENDSLTMKLKNEFNTLRQLTTENDAIRHLTRVEELEIILDNRNELLRKREEELREIRKNRPSTRSTSTQPRSPKWGASSRQTSPVVPGNGNGNGGGGGGGGLPGRGSGLRFSSEALP